MADNHEGNAVVENPNHSICDTVSRINFLEPRLPLVDIVSSATFHTNTACGHNQSPAFELLFHRCPQVSAECNPGEHGTAEENIASNRRRQIYAALQAKARTGTPVKGGDHAFFNRYHHRWIGPEVDVNTIQSTFSIGHNGMVKTADKTESDSPLINEVGKALAPTTNTTIIKTARVMDQLTANLLSRPQIQVSPTGLKREYWQKKIKAC